jgi:hypothetical protein
MAIAALQVLEHHCLKQCRLAGTGFPDDVDMQKAVFVFYAEDTTIVAKVDAAEANGIQQAIGIESNLRPSFIIDARALTRETE